MEGKSQLSAEVFFILNDVRRNEMSDSELEIFCHQIIANLP